MNEYFLAGVDECLEDARSILVERTAEYGDPVNMLSTIGRVWGAMLDIGPIKPERVALLMAGLKISREMVGEAKRDSRIDAISYLSIADSIANQPGPKVDFPE
jgi:hypothetical protein